MTEVWRWCGAFLAVVLVAPAKLAAQPEKGNVAKPVEIVYAGLKDDPRYDDISGYARLVIKRRHAPYAGALVGLREARNIARVAKAHFSLRRIEAPDAATLIRTVAEEQGRGVHFFLLDAPAAVVGKLAAAMKGKPALIFNIADASDDLRRKVCSAEIVHAAPSLVMLTDALIQYLVSKKWRNLVLLEGPDPADAVRAASYQRSARKFGARIVLHKTFRAGNDPRQRESNNPALLTALRGDYDAVIVADRAYEFARSLPYRINKPRPVIGAIGLTPVAWHWAWERNGAPQVNSRFRRLREKSSQHDRKDNQMSGRDWAAWISMKMIAQAVLQAGAGSFEKQRAAILRGSEFDGAKGLAVSVRPWDQQLRQPVLLAGADFVAANAPMPGFLHRTNRLDTLGDDRRETPCQLDGG